MPEHDYTIRRAEAADGEAVLDICRRSLGWDADDPNEEFWRWKHHENPFGESPTWVAVDGSGRILGVRCFMRWGFVSAGGAKLRAVRAVDTATHPDARGLGIFKRLTLGALPELMGDGVDFVFNTPNDKSGPGYLKMGWSEVGRVPLGVQPTRIKRTRRSEGSWRGSAKWGEPSTAGIDVGEAFGDHDDVGRLIERCQPDSRIRTDQSVEFLRWRYGFAPLHYRVMPVGDRIDEGLVVFRLRSRGSRLDVTICDELLPRRRAIDPVYRRLARDTGADVLMRTQTAVLGPGPFLRVRRLGPMLTWKPLAWPEVPDRGHLHLSYGDLELF